MIRKILLLLILGLLSVELRAHEHLAAGANSDAPGTPLLFVNAADFSADAGYVFSLEQGETNTPYFGYYFTEDLVFAALAATPNDGGPEPLHAALGSQIAVVLETLDGPAGGQLGFWETPADDVVSTNLTWSVPVGLAAGTHQILVSENDGSAGADPYGHKHGRVYSATLPGLYRAGFRFIDISTNGPAGGPIHGPSDRFFLLFQAGVTIGGLTQATNGLAITFAAPSNLPDTGEGPATNYTLESSPRLGNSASWQNAAPPVVGDDYIHTVIVPMSTAAGYFRLRTE